MKKWRRFPPEFKAKVVLDVLTGAQSPAEACRKHTPSPNLLGIYGECARAPGHPPQSRAGRC